MHSASCVLTLGGLNLQKLVLEPHQSSENITATGLICFRRKKFNLRFCLLFNADYWKNILFNVEDGYILGNQNCNLEWVFKDWGNQNNLSTVQNYNSNKSRLAISFCSNWNGFTKFKWTISLLSTFHHYYLGIVVNTHSSFLYPIFILCLKKFNLWREPMSMSHFPCSISIIILMVCREQKGLFLTLCFICNLLCGNYTLTLWIYCN